MKPIVNKSQIEKAMVQNAINKAVLSADKSQEKATNELWHQQYGNNKIIAGINIPLVGR